MDFAANLDSDSIRNQVAAAMFLRAEGANGSKHLSALLDKIQQVDFSNELDRFEEALLGFGAMTMGDIVGQIGFDFDLPLHTSILNCILKLTCSANIKVAAHAIYGLGNLNSDHMSILASLCRVVVSELRSDEYEHVTIRAIALRNLKRLDPAKAREFVDTPACHEYFHAVEYWLENDSSKNEDTRTELRHELSWLAENLRTKD